MKANRILGMALLVAGLSLAPAAAADLWLHVKVDGARGAEQVRINMPLSMVESITAMIPDEARSNGKVRFNDREYNADELRRIWRQLEDGPDATYVTINEPDTKVRIAKRGNYLVMDAKDRAQGEDVEARIPITVMAALLSGSGDQLDFGAALRELARYGKGELVTVTGKDETVRVWIDDRSENR